MGQEGHSLTLDHKNICSHALTCMAVHEHLVATGDEEGGVKLWDLRQTKQLFSWQENDDFISELAIVPNKNMILAPRYASPCTRQSTRGAP